MAIISDTRVRAEAKFTSTTTAREYTIHIIDTEHNGVITPTRNIELDRDGFTIEYGSGDKLSPIQGSSFSMGIMIKDVDYLPDLEDLASDIMELQDDRFGIRVYEDDDLMWCGVVYQDGVNIDLTHKPYVFRVTAMCGLGKLKEIASGTPWEIDEHPSNFAGAIIKMLREVDPLELTNGTDFLVSAVDLRANNHRAYNTQFDTLAETTVKDFKPLFYRRWQDVGDRGSIFEGRPWDSVLERILFAFHSQIRMMNGSFEIVPIPKMFVATSTFIRKFDRDYFELHTNTGDPRDYTGVAFGTRTFGSGFTNTKLQDLSVGFEQAADLIVLSEKFGQELINPDQHLTSNTDTGTFSTDDNGFISFDFIVGCYPLKNLQALGRECWVELRAFVSTVYNSQTYYWGPYRQTSSAHNKLGEVLSYTNSWDTTERWFTLGLTNLFSSQNTTSQGHEPPYPDFTDMPLNGILGANETLVVGKNYGWATRTNMHPPIRDTGVRNVVHISGGKGNVTVQLKFVALEKNTNAIISSSNVDTDFTLTDAQKIAGGFRNEKQGTTVRSAYNEQSDTFVHSIDTGQTGLSTLVKDVGNLYINDKRGNVPSEARVYDGTDWDNDTENWTDGTGTPDTPLITYLLRKYAQIYQKPVKRPDMKFIDSLTLAGRTITGAGFPLGSSGTVQYLVLSSKFFARDGFLDQTWLAYDSNEVTNTPVTDKPNAPTASKDDGGPSWFGPPGRIDGDPGTLPNDPE
jgi:hypothetical protein